MQMTVTLQMHHAQVIHLGVLESNLDIRFHGPRMQRVLNFQKLLWAQHEAIRLAKLEAYTLGS